MYHYDLSHFSNLEVDAEVTASATNDCASTARFLASLAEFDARKRYLPAGYQSTFAYCVDHLHLPEDAAVKRIQVARTARQYPALFEAIAEGRLNLTSVRLLSSHLTPQNVEELITAATHRRCAEVEQMLQRRYVRLETLVEGSPPRVETPVSASPDQDVALMIPLPAPEQVKVPALLSERSSTPSDTRAPRPEPSVWVALDPSANERLEYARALLSHRMPLESASKIVEYALNKVIAEEEKRKFAVTDKPRVPRGKSKDPGYIPAWIKRAVWKKYQGRCAAIGENGHRCEARDHLEFDHIIPLARGGQTTVENLRLLCRAHNQYEAERSFGEAFMRRQREEARKRVVPSESTRTTTRVQRARQR